METRVDPTVSHCDSHPAESATAAGCAGAWWPPVSPFKGLAAFGDSELDALFFFGREREREVIVANLLASRLTVLYGESGVGKSSLLAAAVVRDLRPLLFTMARRQVIDGYRRRGARPREVGAWELEEVAAADDLDRSLLALTVKRALMHLDCAHRAVIVGLYFQGRTITDVADLLAIPVGTVKSRAYYGLCALRTTLKRLGINGVT